jgi:hypothetical protein
VKIEAGITGITEIGTTTETTTEIVTETATVETITGIMITGITRIEAVTIGTTEIGTTIETMTEIVTETATIETQITETTVRGEILETITETVRATETAITETAENAGILETVTIEARIVDKTTASVIMTDETDRCAEGIALKKHFPLWTTVLLWIREAREETILTAKTRIIETAIQEIMSMRRSVSKRIQIVREPLLCRPSR